MDVGETAAHLWTRLSALAPGQAWFDIGCGMGNGRIRSTESQWLNCLTRSKKATCHKHYMSRPRDNAERVRRDQFTEASAETSYTQESCHEESRTCCQEPLGQGSTSAKIQLVMELQSLIILWIKRLTIWNMPCTTSPPRSWLASALDARAQALKHSLVRKAGLAEASGVFDRS